MCDRRAARASSRGGARHRRDRQHGHDASLDKEAQDKDFHLLLKPVVPNKLRAMIAFKLGVKPPALELARAQTGS